MKQLIKSLFCLIPLGLFSQVAFSQTGIDTPGFATPESIISNGKRFFVSNIGTKPEVSAKDGDGFIAEISAEGKITQRNFLPKTGKLNAPKGMAIIGNTLYVTDVDRIVGFDLTTRNTIFEWNLSFVSSALLNDLVQVDEYTLLVSDSYKNKVFKLDVREKKVSELQGEVITANGLAYDAVSKLVYVTGMGPGLDGTGGIYVKSLAKPDEAFQLLPGSPLGVLDGLSLLNNQLITSDWVSLGAPVGKLYVYDLAHHTYQVLLPSVQSPADFYLEPITQRMLLPLTLRNQVVVQSLRDIPVQPAADNHLYSSGLVSAFIGGLYDGYTSFSEVKKHGDFGLGAPDRLDGEIVLLDGKVYQTQHTGKTFEGKDSAKTPLVLVDFFHKDRVIKLEKQWTKEQLFHFLDSTLHPNGIYAIHITASFAYMKTRAFPPVAQKPYAPLATMLDMQRLFEFQSITGDLVGYCLPRYLEGLAIPGYHFHFLSTHKDAGGHVIDFAATNLTIEIDTLNEFTLEVPKVRGLHSIDFNANRNAELRRVEKGGK